MARGDDIQQSATPDGVVPLSGLGVDLLAVVAQLDQLSKQRFRLKIPAAQARLLAAIEAHGEARISELAAVDHCSQPTLTIQLRHLVKAGLAMRICDAKDRRVVRIRVTSTGLDALQSIRADRVAAIEPRLAQLSDADRHVLSDAIRIMCGLIETAPDRH